MEGENAAMIKTAQGRAPRWQMRPPHCLCDAAACIYADPDVLGMQLAAFALQ